MATASKSATVATPPFDWTTERTALLRKLWREGMSAGAIATELGATRNAVIGKVHRLELPTRIKVKRVPAATSSKAPTERPRAAPSSSPAPVVARPNACTAKPAPALAAAPVAIAETPCCATPSSDGGGVDITALELFSCRWPIAGDGADMRYCGARTPDLAQPYCTAHRRIAYNPQPRPRARREAHV